MSDQRGFTLVELLTVFTIILIMTTVMLKSFSNRRVDLDQSRAILTEAIRDAQSRAVSGMQYSSANRCGYGLRLLQTGYSLYVGPVADATCGSQDPSYNASTDTIISTVTYPTGTTELVGVPLDIFFLPPNPTTYVCSGSVCNTSVKNVIVIRRVGASCTVNAPSSDCRMLYVSTTGLISNQ